MVAGCVAIPRLPIEREPNGAPRSSASLTLAGVFGAAFSVVVDVINVLMRVLDSNSMILSHKMSNHNPDQIIIGTIMHYGCIPVHGGIHNLIAKQAPCDIIEENNKTELKSLHPDLPVQSLDYDGIVLTNLDTTKRAALVSDTIKGSIISAEQICVLEWHEHQANVACKSTSNSSFHTFEHGIVVM
jgi:hypothetical protein